MPKYEQIVTEDDHVMTFSEFDSFNDHDGVGHPAIQAGSKFAYDWDIDIYPSNRHTAMPDDATHVVWFNK